MSVCLEPITMAENVKPCKLVVKIDNLKLRRGPRKSMTSKGGMKKGCKQSMNKCVWIKWCKKRTKQNQLDEEVKRNGKTKDLGSYLPL